MGCGASSDQQPAGRRKPRRRGSFDGVTAEGGKLARSGLSHSAHSGGGVGAGGGGETDGGTNAGAKRSGSRRKRREPRSPPVAHGLDGARRPRDGGGRNAPSSKLRVEEDSVATISGDRDTTGSGQRMAREEAPSSSRMPNETTPRRESSGLSAIPRKGSGRKGSIRRESSGRGGAERRSSRNSRQQSQQLTDDGRPGSARGDARKGSLRKNSRQRLKQPAGEPPQPAADPMPPPDVLPGAAPPVPEEAEAEADAGAAPYNLNDPNFHQKQQEEAAEMGAALLKMQQHLVTRRRSSVSDDADAAQQHPEGDAANGAAPTGFGLSVTVSDAGRHRGSTNATEFSLAVTGSPSSAPSRKAESSHGASLRTADQPANGLLRAGTGTSQKSSGSGLGGDDDPPQMFLSSRRRTPPEEVGMGTDLDAEKAAQEAAKKLRRFPCDECDRAFGTLRELREHIKDAHGEDD